MRKPNALTSSLAAGFLLAAVFGATLAVRPAGAETVTWRADPAHTEVNFSVKHFFTPVTGTFDDFEIDLNYDPENTENSSVEVRIRVESVNTGNEKRDNHLRSGDWFGAEAHPYMTFTSTSVEKVGDNEFVARGALTIKGHSSEIELPITLLGTQQIPEQMQEMLGGTKEVASFKASASINRGDFEVGVGSWAATMVVGSEINIEILVEAHRK